MFENLGRSVRFYFPLFCDKRKEERKGRNTLVEGAMSDCFKFLIILERKGKCSDNVCRIKLSREI